MNLQGHSNEVFTTMTMCEEHENDHQWDKEEEREELKDAKVRIGICRSPNRFVDDSHHSCHTKSKLDINGVLKECAYDCEGGNDHDEATEKLTTKSSEKNVHKATEKEYGKAKNNNEAR